MNASVRVAGGAGHREREPRGTRRELGMRRPPLGAVVLRFGREQHARPRRAQSMVESVVCDLRVHGHRPGEGAVGVGRGTRSNNPSGPASRRYGPWVRDVGLLHCARTRGWRCGVKPAPCTVTSSPSVYGPAGVMVKGRPGATAVGSKPSGTSLSSRAGSSIDCTRSTHSPTSRSSSPAVGDDDDTAVGRQFTVDAQRRVDHALASACSA